MAWEPISSFPNDGRHGLFASVHGHDNDVIEELNTEGLIQAVGHIDDDGNFVKQQEITGTSPDDWKPTHWLNEKPNEAT